MNACRTLTIAGRAMGSGHPCWIVAEIGVNHDGDLEKARELIQLAAASGADAVKLQSFDAEELVLPGTPLSGYQRGHDPSHTDQLTMLRRLQLPSECWAGLQEVGRSAGVTLFASPFDSGSLERLIALEMPAIKLGSGELTNEPLLRRAASSGIPLLLSTGMAHWGEIDDAVSWARSEGSEPTIMHCVTAYPTPLADANVAAVTALAERTGCLVGYSDHTQGVVASLAARAVGACVIERHLTYDTTAAGPDHSTSLDGAAFSSWVRKIRDLEAALGDGDKQHRQIEEEGRRNARKSIVAVRTIDAGSEIVAGMLDIRRPGTGLPPARWNHVLGCRACRRVPQGAALTEEDIAPVECETPDAQKEATP